MGYISDYGKGMVINMSFLKEEQFAAMNLIYSRCKMDYFLDSIQRLGICNIELWTQIPYFCELDQSLCDLTNIRRRLAIQNLHLICLIPEQCSWPFNIASDDPEIRRSSVDFYRRHFEMAQIFGGFFASVTAPGQKVWAYAGSGNSTALREQFDVQPGRYTVVCGPI